jgi:signal transduction histidine kinase/CheY-like chemotaxis protein
LKLRTHLLLLAAGVLLPIAIFAALQARLLVNKEADTFRRSAVENARSVMTAVDTELRGSIATVSALATSRNLESGDLRAFHEEASRILSSQPGWMTVTLADPDGQQVVNTLVPYGQKLPVVGDRPSLERAVKAGTVSVGGVTTGVITRRAGVPIRIPVVSRQHTYVLTAFVGLEGFGDLLKAQRVPPAWRLGIVDANGYFVARLPDLPGETPAKAVLYERLKQSPEGWFQGRTSDDADTYIAYNTSDFSGWLAAIAIPTNEVETPRRRAMMSTAAGAVLALVIALAAAVLLSRRIAGPMSSLASGAEAIGRGEAFDVPTPGRVQEVHRVAEALRGAATAVKEREQALEAANSSKDEFLAMLSHELRNPLAAIVTSIHVLQRAHDRPDLVQQTCAILERQSAQMRRLVEDLLDVSRITTGKISLERSAMDLARAAERVVATWRSAGRLARHQIALDISSAWIDGDTTRIEQIISNLLDNSVKFTPEGGRITVRTCRRGAEALLEVSDTGAGLDESVQDSVFDVFVQGSQSIERSSGGLGLGLSIVRRLAVLHGGNAEARSEGIGRGTTVTVRFPASQPPQAAAPQPETPTRQPHNRDILLVEDNEDARVMLRAALELEGHTVRDAADGASALSLALEAPPEVAVIDIGLPDMNGYELAQRLRQSLQQNVRLIALTGYGQPEDKARALAAGFDVHLTKPVDQGSLRELIA